MRLPQLLSDLIGDLQEPDVLWQAVAIVASMALGWALARVIRAQVRQRSAVVTPGHEGRTAAVRSFTRVLGPLLILGALALSRYILAHYQHVNILNVAVPLASSFVVIRTAFYLLRRVFARGSEQLGATFQTFEKVFALVVWVAVALYITGVWPDIIHYLDRTTLPIGRNKVALADILQGGASVVVLLMLALWAGTALDERLMGVQGLNMSLRVVLARVSRALLIVVAVLVSLSMVGIDLTVLSVFGGALGVGLGLGLQKIASNYVSGFVILLERSLSIGDMITVDKYSGIVSQINTRYTVLKGLDGVDTVLPNEMLISSVVQNQSLSSRNIRGSTVLTVAYGSDLDVVIPLLESMAAGVPRVLETPGPGVSLNSFKPDGFELELGFWIVDPESGRGGVISEINKRIYKLVESGDIKLAKAHLTVEQVERQIATALGNISQTVTN
jgi:small-conductance mechanosensitive channel